MKPRLHPYGASRYDDVYIKCPFCHDHLVYFRGGYKYIKCNNCGAKFKDRTYAESCVAYKSLKHKGSVLGRKQDWE